MREITALYALNRGLVSPLGIARSDQKRISLSAETMTNWICRVLGSMSFRPELQYIGATHSSAAARFLPFVFATNDTALIEFTDLTLRIWINDVVLTRVSVSTTITNGTFAGNISGWSDSSDAGASTSYQYPNTLKLVGAGTGHAVSYQAVSVSSADQTKEHGLRVVVSSGPVLFKVEHLWAMTA